jgi:hypothetical protein
MRDPTYPIIVALALMLVAPPLSAFAQQDPPIVYPPIVNPPIVDLPIVAPPSVTDRPLRPRTFSGREVADDATAAPPPPQQPKHAFYYHPGDLKGVRYNTIEECTKARQRGGDVGVCVYK